LHGVTARREVADSDQDCRHGEPDDGNQDEEHAKAWFVDLFYAL
jgi:hypothetical protein